MAIGALSWLHPLWYEGRHRQLQQHSCLFTLRPEGGRDTTPHDMSTYESTQKRRELQTTLLFAGPTPRRPDELTCRCPAESKAELRVSTSAEQQSVKFFEVPTFCFQYYWGFSPPRRQYSTLRKLAGLRGDSGIIYVSCRERFS